MEQGHHRADRELPFEPQPDVDQDRRQRPAHGKEGGLDQLARDFGAHGFDRGELDIGGHALQCRFDGFDRVGRRRLLPFLGLHADHRHMAVGTETGIEDLGNRDVAQFKRRERIAVSAHVDGLGAFGPQGGAAPEVDAEVQPHHAPSDQGQDHQHHRSAKGDLGIAEEIEVRIVGYQLQSHVKPRLSWDGGVQTRSPPANG